MRTSRCDWHCYQTNWMYYFLKIISLGLNCNCFQVHFWGNYAKIANNFRNHISQDSIISHKNQYPSPVCNFSFTAPHYSDKCLIKFATFSDRIHKLDIVFQPQLAYIGYVSGSLCPPPPHLASSLASHLQWDSISEPHWLKMLVLNAWMEYTTSKV